MADVEFKWDPDGAERLLESTGPILKRKADAVAAAASASGGRYVSDLESGSHAPRAVKNRVYAAVTTADVKAMSMQTRSNALLKALASGRG